MFVLSKKESGESFPISVHYTFASAKYKLLDELLFQYQKNGAGKEDISRLKRMHDQAKPSKTIEFRSYRISIAQNLITSETAVKKIVHHIKHRFSQIPHDTRMVCIRKDIITDHTRKCWMEMDQHNGLEAVKHIENIVQTELNTLRLKGIHIRVAIVDESTEDFTYIKFTNSYEAEGNHRAFCIAVTPCTGYQKTLESASKSENQM